MKRFKTNEGYLRFKRQLNALVNDDMNTVKRLAQEARDVLQLKQEGRMQMRIAR